MKKIIPLKIGFASISIGLSTLVPVLFARPVLGAERLNLSYGLLERSISVDSLEEYAKTGKVDNNLAAYTQYANSQQLANLKKALLTPIPLNALQVSQFLYTPTGETLLKSLGNIIQSDSRLNGYYAIRGSLILAATDPKGLTLLNVLRQFPSETISINLVRTVEVAQEILALVKQTQQAVELINQQSNRQSNQQAGTSIRLSTPIVKDLRKRGLFMFDKRTIILNDQSRKRIFPADIYLPRTSGQRPVIVISHGLGSDRTSFAYLAQQLASYGFVVAVPEHPGSNAQQLQALLAGTAAQVTSPREFVDRPLDVKFLLDELGRLSQSDASYQGHLNLQQVGVVGQSFGGYTALALAGARINTQQLRKNCPTLENNLNISLLLQCLALQLPQQQYNLSDPRVKAAIAIDPVDSSVMGQASLSQIKIPVMIVAGSNDTIAPALLEQIQPFTWLTTANKYLVAINGATHFSTIADSPNSVVPLPSQITGSDPELARSYVQALSVAFFQTYIARQPNYAFYLNSAYTNTISEDPLKLSLVQSFTLPK